MHWRAMPRPSPCRPPPLLRAAGPPSPLVDKEDTPTRRALLLSPSPSALSLFPNPSRAPPLPPRSPHRAVVPAVPELKLVLPGAPHRRLLHPRAKNRTGTAAFAHAGRASPVATAAARDRFPPIPAAPHRADHRFELRVSSSLSWTSPPPSSPPAFLSLCERRRGAPLR